MPTPQTKAALPIGCSHIHIRGEEGAASRLQPPIIACLDTEVEELLRENAAHLWDVAEGTKGAIQLAGISLGIQFVLKGNDRVLGWAIVAVDCSQAVQAFVPALANPEQYDEDLTQVPVQIPGISLTFSATMLGRAAAPHLDSIGDGLRSRSPCITAVPVVLIDSVLPVLRLLSGGGGSRTGAALRRGRRLVRFQQRAVLSWDWF
mmetsp:Transcript_38152/g.107814  ORF Transcript_38152/g.107814 Transcript_38152/m.107814 type:complete len:205 (+) Transcript_38152:399-1013(+)